MNPLYGLVFVSERVNGVLAMFRQIDVYHRRDDLCYCCALQRVRVLCVRVCVCECAHSEN